VDEKRERKRRKNEAGDAMETGLAHKKKKKSRASAQGED
jgi:hypothetical protein